MKFELIEDINSSLENEYDELQGYLSSTINKLKETTVTLENISKSYDHFNRSCIFTFWSGIFIPQQELF